MRVAGPLAATIIIISVLIPCRRPRFHICERTNERTLANNNRIVDGQSVEWIQSRTNGTEWHQHGHHNCQLSTMIMRGLKSNISADRARPPLSITRVQSEWNKSVLAENVSASDIISRTESINVRQLVTLSH